jgi:protein-S-isoprenylcysteine O-methyltransferase Ste14
MYVGVLLVAIGQAVLFASPLLAAYSVAVFVFFHLIVVFVEEPHLRVTRGGSYDLYCRAVPRWLGLPSRRRKTES